MAKLKERPRMGKVRFLLGFVHRFSGLSASPLAFIHPFIHTCFAFGLNACTHHPLQLNIMLCKCIKEKSVEFYILSIPGTENIEALIR
ncbi:hypothetical protein V6N11_027557 [Hibiscus sabdariffa]|uniref:Uncharacterized protein n=1 Tax=Hibiscus sabdariffa TaxID=183260 RepID=A0ABR2PHA3_9ROSI